MEQKELMSMRMWSHLAGLSVLLVASVWMVACTGTEPSSAPPTAEATPTVAAPTGTPTGTIATASIASLFLDIEKPESQESVVSTADITVVGRTRADAGVSVNDVFADVDQDGRFTVPLQLEEGPNIIQVVASVESGEEMAKVLTLIYSP